MALPKVLDVLKWNEETIMAQTLPFHAHNTWHQRGIVVTAVLVAVFSRPALADQDFPGETITAEKYVATDGTAGGSTTEITASEISTGEISANSIQASGSVSAGYITAGGIGVNNVITNRISGIGGNEIVVDDKLVLVDSLDVLSSVSILSGLDVSLGDIRMGTGDLILGSAGHVSIGDSTLDEAGLQIDGGPTLTRSGLDMHGEKMTGVADGDVTVSSQDAINGRQLHATAESMATALGGGASVAADGTVSMPVYDFDGHNYADVGAVFIAIDDAFSAIGGAAGSLATTQVMAGEGATASGSNTVAVGDHSVASGARSTAVGAGARASADNSVALGAGSVASRPNTVSVGEPGAERQIVNVAPGTHGTDAVNLNQLDAATTRMHKYAARAAAASMAQPAIPYLNAGERWAGAALGTYDGEQAIGLALSAQMNDKFSVGLGLSRALSGSAPVAGRVQVGVRW